MDHHVVALSLVLSIFPLYNHTFTLKNPGWRLEAFDV
jgi:hypothetical protein